MGKKNISEAGDGNRTHVSSLEGWCSTIELHPHGADKKLFYLLFGGMSSVFMVNFLGGFQKVGKNVRKP